LYFETEDPVNELLVMKCGSARECCQWFMVYLFSFAGVQIPSARGAHPSRKACKSRGMKVATRPLDTLRRAGNLSRRHLKLLLKPSKKGRTKFTLRVKEQALLLTLQSMMMMMMMATSTDSSICKRKENFVPCDYRLCCRVK
jgi:hypothetical protein